MNGRKKKLMMMLKKRKKKGKKKKDEGEEGEQLERRFLCFNFHASGPSLGLI